MAIYEAEFTTPGTSARVWLVLQVDLVSQSIPLNRSTVNWYLRGEERIVNASPYNLGGACTASAVVNATVFSSGGLNYDYRASFATNNISSGTANITHNSDGTKTITISASWSGDAILGSASFSTTMVLPTIPRASTPTFDIGGTPVTAVDAGTAVDINTNRADAGFTHTIEYNFEGAGWNTIATGVGADTPWTPSTSLLSSIPNATSGVAQIRTTTFSGVTQIGSPTTVPITINVPASALPDFTTITNSENVTLVATEVGAYVQNLTKLNLAITGAAGIYGSTISTYKIEVAGQTINASSGVTPAVVNASGTVALVGTITDSRGRQRQKTVNVTFLSYALPSVSAIQFRRADASGVVDEQGDRIRVDLTAAVQSLVVSTVQKNSISYKISTSPRDAGTWTLKTTVTVTAPAVTFNSFDFVGTYAIEDSFDVKVEVYDKFNTATVQGTVATAVVLMHWDEGLGVGMGKFREDGFLDVNGDIYQNGLQVLDTGDVASTSAAGIQENATTTEAAAGIATDKTVTPDGLLAFAQARPPSRNYARNARFRVNQRAAVSGTSLASGAYFLDGWKSTTSSNAVTWTGSDAAGRTLTIPSSETIAQIIEGDDLVTDDYMLVWSGTSQGRINSGSYGASGVPVASLTAGTNVTIEFNAGTLSWVALVRVDQWTGFLPDISYAEDLLKCQRYFWRVKGIATNQRMSSGGYQVTTTQAEAFFVLPTTMRISPTLAVNSCYWTDGVTFNAAITSTSLQGGVSGQNQQFNCYVHFGASGAAHRPGVVSAQSSSSYFDFIADL